MLIFDTPEKVRWLLGDMAGELVNILPKFDRWATQAVDMDEDDPAFEERFLVARLEILDALLQITKVHIEDTFTKLAAKNPEAAQSLKGEFLELLF